MNELGSAKQKEKEVIKKEEKETPAEEDKVAEPKASKINRKRKYDETIEETKEKDDLQSLLKFEIPTDGKTSVDFQKNFEKIADKILNGCAIVAKKGKDIKIFRIIEIEFYCTHKTLHNDNFTHQDHDQLQFLEWYFHKFGKNYKAGTYKGLDITFGREDIKMYGGILLRTIQDASSFEFYEGSCTLVSQIFKFFDVKEVNDFIAANKHFTKNNIYKISDLDDIKLIKEADKVNALTLVELTGDKTDFWKRRPIYSSPRVGLTLKRIAEEKEKYLMKNYRFCTNPDKIKKCKNQIYLGLVGQGIKDASTITNFKKKSADESLEAYNKGFKGKETDLKSFIGKDLSSSDT